jgi:hypothetical protein
VPNDSEKNAAWGPYMASWPRFSPITVASTISGIDFVSIIGM